MNLKKRKRKIFSLKYFIFDFAKVTGIIPALLIWRPKRIYENKIAKKILHGPAIVISNHTGYLDPLSMQFSFMSRRFHIVTSTSVLKNSPIVKKFLTIPIDKEQLPFQTIKDIFNALDYSNVVGIFPEGHINESDELLNPFKVGVVEIALKKKVPIIPIFMKKKKKWYDRAIIAIGEPIKYDENLVSTKELKEQLTKQLYDKEIELSKLIK